MIATTSLLIGLLVIITLSFLKIASHPSSHSCPTDTNEVCRLGKWCDSLAEVDTLGRQRDNMLVDNMVSSLGSVTWIGMWLGLCG